jgi:hypothetical protein
MGSPSHSGVRFFTGIGIMVLVRSVMLASFSRLLAVCPYSEVGPLGFATGLLTNFSKTGSKRKFQPVNGSDAKYCRFSKKR